MICALLELLLIVTHTISEQTKSPVYSTGTTFPNTHILSIPRAFSQHIVSIRSGIRWTVQSRITRCTRSHVRIHASVKSKIESKP